MNLVENFQQSEWAESLNSKSGHPEEGGKYDSLSQLKTEFKIWSFWRNEEKLRASEVKLKWRTTSQIPNISATNFSISASN